MNKIKSVVPGGKTGQDSIYIGLKEASKYCEYNDVVLIHDGVRPFITEDLITRVIEDTKKNGNSITCTGCNETFITSSGCSSAVLCRLHGKGSNELWRRALLFQKHDFPGNPHD